MVYCKCPAGIILKPTTVFKSTAHYPKNANHGEARFTDAASWRGSEGQVADGDDEEDADGDERRIPSHTARSLARPILTPSSS